MSDDAEREAARLALERRRQVIQQRLAVGDPGPVLPPLDGVPFEADRLFYRRAQSVLEQRREVIEARLLAAAKGRRSQRP